MKLPRLRRPVRPVTLPGGDVVHVRGLTIAELRRIDTAAEGVEDLSERQVRTALTLAALALVEADGTPLYPVPSTDDLDAVAELLTPDQLGAVCQAAAGDKADAKN